MKGREEKISFKLARLQQLQQSLQIIVAERQRLEIEFSETERALNETKSLADEGVIYKSIGSLLIKSDKSTVMRELEEKKELLNTRISVLARQEERTREKLKEVEREVQQGLKGEGERAF